MMCGQSDQSLARLACRDAFSWRLYAVIDGIASLGLGRADPNCREAIVVLSEGHTYALLVEEVEDVVEANGAPVPVNAPIGRGWDRVGIGMVEADDDLLLGEEGNDLVYGRAGQDVMIGGLGNDTIYGGYGRFEDMASTGLAADNLGLGVGNAGSAGDDNFYTHSRILIKLRKVGYVPVK